MAIQIQGNAGVTAEVDEARNLNVQNTVIAGYPTAGGWYTVTGRSGTAVIAAALAANTALMTARFATGSTRKAYVTKFRILMHTTLIGAASGVPGDIGIVRFSAATPTGGTASTPARLGPTKGSTSDMTDIRSSNAALTGGTFGDVLGSSLTPTGGAYNSVIEWVFEPAAPIELIAGDGISLRTLTAQPATATWAFSYNMHWFER